MSAKLDYVLDELLDARRVWDTEAFATAAIMDTIPLNDPKDEHIMQAGTILSCERMIINAPDVFFIEPDMHRLILAAGNTFEPEPLLSTDLITPTGYVRLPEGIDVSRAAHREGFHRLQDEEDPNYTPKHSAFGWVKVPLIPDTPPQVSQGMGILLAFFHTRSDVPLVGTTIYPSRYIGWPLKDTVPEDEWKKMPGWHPDYLYPRVFFRLIMQRITQVEAQNPETLPRAIRRRHEREGYKPARYSVVRLRRRAPRSEPGEGEREKVEWSHRWLVGGHWRQQWYPSLKEHRQVWIDDYVKGPEDKELIIRPRVFDVKD